MRERKLAKNTISSLIFQVTTIVSGFILPRLILKQYGSSVNGLVNSIAQFLSIISFLELGVGAVVQSTLYKPLAENDNVQVSKILASAEKFFKNLARILIIYIIILVFCYPYLGNQKYSFLYTATLIGAMCISYFAQYYFGVVDRLLLTADQKGYIQYNAQTITLILNTVISISLIKCGSSIQLLKLMSSLIYLFRPIYLRIYINRHYVINRKISYDEEPIKQKWNGVAQHVCSVVLDSTDNIVLTIFATLSDVSIYSVYYLVVSGVKQLFLSLTNGIQSLIGELWAKQELDNLKKYFEWIEWSIHTGVVFIFGCTLFLIVPFVQVYTEGITDANYVVPSFAILLTVANAMHCLRLPYNIMILAAGHYKQTQCNYIISTIMNIVLSIMMVQIWGLIGVAIGTICAMTFQTMWMMYYDSKNFIKWPLVKSIKQFSIDIFTIIIGFIVCNQIHMKNIDIISWVLLAFSTIIIFGCIIVAINMIFYREKIVRLLKVIRKGLN